ncbi:MAG: hypothetical protein DRQ63_05025 [Gammaproteobacteria bacterium]|nr:MAG: hypothetical protein DRQ63_05025 [Gammaproteobacteria bacterium]
MRQDKEEILINRFDAFSLSGRAVSRFQALALKINSHLSDVTDFGMAGELPHVRAQCLVP